MVSKKIKRNDITNICAEGGKGILILDKFNGLEGMPEGIKLHAYATLEPGASVGYHVHHGEIEIYYILSGKGIYSDNGNKREVSAGDVTFTADGCGHGLENIGTEVLEFMALIVAE